MPSQLRLCFVIESEYNITKAAIYKKTAGRVNYSYDVYMEIR